METNIYIKRRDTKEIIKTIDVTNRGKHNINNILDALCQQVDYEEFYIDYTEIEPIISNSSLEE